MVVAVEVVEVLASRRGQAAPAVPVRYCRRVLPGELGAVGVRSSVVGLVAGRLGVVGVPGVRSLVVGLVAGRLGVVGVPGVRSSVVGVVLGRRMVRVRRCRKGRLGEVGELAVVVAVEAVEVLASRRAEAAPAARPLGQEGARLRGVLRPTVRGHTPARRPDLGSPELARQR